MFESLGLRLRLTIWYSGLVAIVLAGFGIFVWVLLLVTLRYQVDQRLALAAEQVRLHGVEDKSWLNAETQSIVRFDDFQGSGLYLQIFDQNKKLVAVSSNLKHYTTSLDPESLNETGISQTRPREVQVAGQSLRVLTLPLAIEQPDGSQKTYLLQVAASMRDVKNAELALVLVLVAGLGGSLVVSFIAGSLSIERALRPLNQVTQTALTISRADDLSRRVAYKGKDDEIGRLVSAMNQTLERLERLFNSQRRFLSDISHELRTPLTTIRGNVNIIQRTGIADEESLDAIQGETDRLSRLAGDLLTIAQAEGGNLPLVLKQVELDTLLLELFRDARLLAAGKVRVMLGEEDQVQIQADRDRIRQVLLNLVSNAIKYTPTGGAVTIGMRRLDNWVRITVSDTGRGIPPEDLPFIFDRFYRVEKSRTRNDRSADAGGAGLGLSIAKWLVEAHHGRIEVTSELGRGSAFNVWLPLRQPGQGSAEPETTPPHLLQTLPAIPAELIRNLRKRGTSSDKATGKTPKQQSIAPLADAGTLDKDG